MFLLDLPVKDLCVRGLALQKLWITSSKTGNLIQGYIFWQFPRGLKKGREKWRKKGKREIREKRRKGKRKIERKEKKTSVRVLRGKSSEVCFLFMTI